MGGHCAASHTSRAVGKPLRGMLWPPHGWPCQTLADNFSGILQWAVLACAGSVCLSYWKSLGGLSNSWRTWTQDAVGPPATPGRHLGHASHTVPAARALPPVLFLTPGDLDDW